MALELADLTQTILDEFGESATLCGDGWRQTVTVVFTPVWAPAEIGGIGIDRAEPIAQLRTTDVTTYDAANGWTLEVGSNTYRITSKADDGLGLTTLTLAKQ